MELDRRMDKFIKEVEAFASDFGRKPGGVVQSATNLSGHAWRKIKNEGSDISLRNARLLWEYMDKERKKNARKNS